MAHEKHIHLTRRERQIMDVLYARREATAAYVHRNLPDSPSYSAVRALLKKLIDKGHVIYREDGPRYVYRPVVAKNAAKQSALERLLETFFDGSAAEAVVSLLGNEKKRLTAEEIKEIEAALARVAERARR